MTKKEMLYEMARKTKTTSGMLVRCGKSAHELDALAKKHTLADIESAYKNHLADPDHTLMYIEKLKNLR